MNILTQLNITKIRKNILGILLSGSALLLAGCNKLALLDPKGVIAADQKNLLLTAVFLMLLVVVPVIILNFIFAWRYRASNTKATYRPDWAHSVTLEIVWWSIPCVIIAILATLTWITSHRLDPYRPINSSKPLAIQAIALDWNWLFIYPNQNIAAINRLVIPENVPIEIYVTADAPMNSLQIPRLAGQIYAMTGMQTKINIMATSLGDFRGQSTNFSGDGFTDMHFVVQVKASNDFKAWVNETESSPEKLTMAEYQTLAKPNINHPVEYFSFVDKDLFSKVMMKYMMPMKSMQSMKS